MYRMGYFRDKRQKVKESFCANKFVGIKCWTQVVGFYTSPYPDLLCVLLFRHYVLFNCEPSYLITAFVLLRLCSFV